MTSNIATEFTRYKEAAFSKLLACAQERLYILTKGCIVIIKIMYVCLGTVCVCVRVCVCACVCVSIIM